MKRITCPTQTPVISRRSFCGATTAALASGLLPRSSLGRDSKEFKLNYLLGSCMYGYGKIEDILPEVRKTGATAIDIWPKVHGNQREQLDAMGEERFRALLKEHDVALGCITQ